MKRLGLALLGLVVAAPAAVAGDWTWNIGYHNPVVSTFGLNLLWFGQDFGFEAGIGWIDVNSSTAKKKDDTSGADGKETTHVTVAGGLNGKYFLTGGKLRPYLQAGIGIGIGASAGEHSGIGAGTGAGYGGIGLMAGSPGFYGYGAFNIDGSKDTFLQAGLGADL